MEFTNIEGDSSVIASPFPAPSSSKGHELEMAKRTPNKMGEMTHSSSMRTLAAVKDGSTKILPFEFLALEVCLELACRSLEEEVCVSYISQYFGSRYLNISRLFCSIFHLRIACL